MIQDSPNPGSASIQFEIYFRADYFLDSSVEELQAFLFARG
ncbi:MAG: hypothetical protein RH862_08200 [Leptospiraceae bacterium]